MVLKKGLVIVSTETPIVPLLPAAEEAGGFAPSGRPQPATRSKAASKQAIPKGIRLGIGRASGSSGIPWSIGRGRLPPAQARISRHTLP